MRAADPTIKVGVVSIPGEDNYSNAYTNHPATNSITGQVHYGWTPVLLSTLNSLGATPDFVIYHRYPEYSSAGEASPADSDPLLFSTSSGWAVDASDLRQEIAGYFGANGTNIELMCTENNSDAGAQGRQSTSLVNGLYYADSRGHLMQTEFNAFVWWDLRNGTDTTGSFDSTLYGWRTYGDLGMVNNLNTLHPTYYAAKLMQYLAQAGDTILSASSDYPLLSAFAARNSSGAISVLVLNKDTTANFNAQIALNGFTPANAAVVRSYGIPQDEAARTNGPASAQDIATNSFAAAAGSFNYNFPALSMTLFTLAPTAPSLSVLPASQTGGSTVLQIQGQPNVRYIIQSSTNLTTWTSISTNSLTASTLNLTNPVPTARLDAFWRAVWQP
jgi:alpha-N-arabinofuranosidase